MARFTHSLGWTVDTDARTISADPAGPDSPLPDASLGSLVLFGLNYLTSQAAGRTVGDHFKRLWADAERTKGNPVKVSDAPKSAVPDPESPEYRAALQDARDATFAKLVQGYVYNSREGGADPHKEELYGLGRQWLQRFAEAHKWYVLPAKRKVARDEDTYADPKGRYATFGEALDAFVSSTADSKHFAMKDGAGKPWPIKVRAGQSLADLLDSEARRRVAERDTPRAGVTVSVDETVDF